MDEEWDLHAVVRSYTTVSTAGSGGNTTTSVDDYDDGFDTVETLASGNDINPFSYSTSGENPSEGLEDVYKEGCSQRLSTAAAATVSGDDEQLPVLLDGCDSFSNETPSRKRKNQQKKMVVELRQEELFSDTWAWRKYGQKPIKGSPFPRNYYKCSTTKACGARKQVEQSHLDPTVFIVSYTGNTYTLDLPTGVLSPAALGVIRSIWLTYHPSPMTRPIPPKTPFIFSTSNKRVK